jgi:hypothetical protein
MHETNSPIDHSRFQLRGVTLCAVDTLNPALAARALDISLSQCDFGDALLLTHAAVPTQARVEHIEPIRSLAEYSHFMLKRLGEYIATPWVLVVQWDGYVLDASKWSERFYQYDYIGARWPDSSSGNDVGNGGFSLRSAKLLKALASDQFVIDANTPEDVLIGSTWRQALEADHGIRIAPGQLADDIGPFIQREILSSLNAPPHAYDRHAYAAASARLRLQAPRYSRPTRESRY